MAIPIFSGQHDDAVALIDSMFIGSGHPGYLDNGPWIPIMPDSQDQPNLEEQWEGGDDDWQMASQCRLDIGPR